MNADGRWRTKNDFGRGNGRERDGSESAVFVSEGRLTRWTAAGELGMVLREDGGV